MLYVFIRKISIKIENACVKKAETACVNVPLCTIFFRLEEFNFLLFLPFRLIHSLGCAGRVLDAVVLEGEDAGRRRVLAEDGQGVVASFSSELHSTCKRNTN